jgi:hypothetical protein
MATHTRAELDASNSLYILGIGKVTKSKHATHNNKIGDYVDYKTEPLNVELETGPDGLVLVSSFNGNVFTYTASPSRMVKLEAISGFVGQKLTLINSSNLPSGGGTLFIESNGEENDIQNGVSFVYSLTLLPGNVKTLYNNGFKWVVV